MENKSSCNPIVSGADILLVIPPPFFTRMPHIGVAYLSSFLKAKGFKVSVYDLSLKLYNCATDELKKFWQIDLLNKLFVTEAADSVYKNFEQQITRFVEDVLATDIKVIGFSVNIISIFLANRIAMEIKKRDPDRFIIFGGPGTYFKHPRELTESGFVDLYIIGEGELTLSNILISYYSGKNIETAPGILSGNDLGRCQAIPGQIIHNLNTIPPPTFSEFNLGDYNQGNEYKPLPLLLNRGCINRCSYCIDCIMWPKYRSRSPKHIMAEIDYHINKNNTKAFEILDLTCNGNLGQLSKTCGLIIDSGYKFDWVSYAVIRRNMDFALLRKMKQAGCNTLIYGVENGSDRILKKMGKRYTAKEASGVIRTTHKAGIRVNINIIVGFPGETEKDFEDTIDFIRENKDYINEVTNVSGCTLFPEAEIGINSRKYGIVWDEHSEPMLYEDSNGLNRSGRIERVARMVEAISELNLSKSIINKPALAPIMREAR